MLNGSIDVADADGPEMIVRCTQEALDAIAIYVHRQSWGEVFHVVGIIPEGKETIADYRQVISPKKS